MQSGFDHNLAYKGIAKTLSIAMATFFILVLADSCVSEAAMYTMPPVDHYHTNVATCKNGWSVCDMSSLSANDSGDVLVQQININYRNCLAGLDNCDMTKLNSPQRDAVQTQNQNRNRTACFRGESTCNLGLLSAADQYAVAHRAYPAQQPQFRANYKP